MNIQEMWKEKTLTFPKLKWHGQKTFFIQFRIKASCEEIPAAWYNISKFQSINH